MSYNVFPPAASGDEVYGFYYSKGDASYPANYLPITLTKSVSMPAGAYRVQQFTSASPATSTVITVGPVTVSGIIDPTSSGLQVFTSSVTSISTSFTPDIVWSGRTSQFAGSIFSLRYANNIYLAGGDSGQISTSTNGTTWTSRLNGGNTIRDFAYGNGVYVAVGSGSRCHSSTDAITWVSRNNGNGGGENHGVVFGNGLFVSVGGFGGGTFISTSTDGITWVTRLPGNSNPTLRKVAYGNGVYAAVGASGLVYSSTDAITWVTRNGNFSTNTFSDIVFAQGVFVAGGGTSNTSNIRTSTDGITWVTRNSAASSTIEALGYSSSAFYAVGGTSPNIQFSTNGISWTSGNTFGHQSTTLYSTAYGNNGGLVTGGPAGILHQLTNQNATRRFDTVLTKVDVTELQ